MNLQKTLMIVVAVHHLPMIQKKNQLKNKRKLRRLKKQKNHHLHQIVVIQMKKNHLHLAAAHLQMIAIKTKVIVIKKVKRNQRKKL